MHPKKDKKHAFSTFDKLPPLSETDGNNNTNKKSEKYSLRQRHKRQCSRTKQSTPQAPITKNDKTPSIVTNPAASSSHNDCRKPSSTTKQRPKSKAAPLSKYRRKTANARERTRMREINSAFENLRKCVPLSISNGTPTPTNNEKLTKITTLRLAMKYIRTLNEVLCSPFGEHNFLLSHVTNNNNNDTNFMTNNNSSSSCSSLSSSTGSNGSKDILSDLFLSATSSALVSNRTKRTNCGDAVRFQKQQRSKLPSKKSIDSPCLSSSIDSSSMDLRLMLESDGESLHLSEPCLSPLSHNIKSFNCSTTSALELGILLDSDTESLQLSEPCLSPLGGLDSLNPFCDLLHTGYSEQSGLDLYLTS